MSRFAVLALLVLVGCSDPVAEYNQQKELLGNLRAEMNAIQDRVEAYGEQQFPAYAKKKIGVDLKALDEARSKVGSDNALTSNDKLERLSQIDDDERRFNELKDKTWTPGTPEWDEFKEIAKQSPDYERGAALRDRIESTEKAILELEKKLPRK